MPRFDLAAWGNYILTGFLGALLLKVIEFIGHKVTRWKEINRSYKIELARIETSYAHDQLDYTYMRDGSMKPGEIERRKAERIELAERVREIDIEELGKFWTWLGKMLGFIL